MTLQEMIEINCAIYGIPDDRMYDLDDIFYYHQKWLLRYVDDKKHSRTDSAWKNFLITTAWFLAIINRVHLDLEQILYKRYSWKCPFCLELPCQCDTDKKGRKSRKTGRPAGIKPATITAWQVLIEKIYPASSLGFKNLAILQSQDQFHQTFRNFRRESSHRSLRQIEIASADYFVEILKIANQFKFDLGNNYKELFSDGCFVCHKSPCGCFYQE